jgi:hypothetical protein
VKASGFNATINGVVTFNPFLLSLIIRDTTLNNAVVLNQEKSCSSSIVLLVPEMRINVVTGSISVVRTNAIITSNGDNKFLKDSFAGVLNMLNNKILTVSQSNLQMQSCSLLKKVTGENQPNELLGDTMISIDHINLDRSDIKTLLAVKMKIFNEIMTINYAQVGAGSKKINVKSNIINLDIDFNRYDALNNPSAVAGAYSVNIINGSALAELFGLHKNNILHQLLSRGNVSGGGKIIYNSKGTAVNNEIATSFGKGFFKMTLPSNSSPMFISLHFDNITLPEFRKYDNDTVLQSSNPFANLLYSAADGIDCGMNITADKMTIIDDVFTDMNLSFALRSGFLDTSKTSFSVNFLRGSIKTDVALSSANEARIPVVFNGANLYSMLQFTNRFILNSAFKIAKTDNIPYKRLGYFTFNYLTKDVGFQDIVLQIADKQVIKAAYLVTSEANADNIMVPIGKFKLDCSGVDVSNLIDKSSVAALLGFMKSRARDVSFLDTFLTNTVSNRAYYLNLNCDNCILEKRNIASVKFNIKHFPYYVLIDNMQIDSDFAVGGLNMLIDVKSADPLININGKMQFVDIDIINNFIDTVVINTSFNKDVNSSWVMSNLESSVALPILSQFSGDLKVYIAKIKYANTIINDCDIVATMGNGNLAISQAIFAINRATISLNGNIRFDAIPLFNINVNSINVKAGDILKILSPSITVDGNFSVKGGFEAKGNTLRNIIGSITGSFAILSQDLLIDGLDFNSLSVLLRQPDIDYGNINYMDIIRNGKKMSFQNAYGDIAVQNGVASTDGIKMKTTGVSGMSKFSINLLDGVINSLDGQFLLLAWKPSIDTRSFLTIPIATKSIGSLTSMRTEIFDSRINEYLLKMSEWRSANIQKK